MAGRWAKRAGEVLAVLLLASFATFALQTMVPQDPAVLILGEGRSPEEYAEVREDLGLDDHLLVRYGRWLGDAVQGDLGESIIPPRTDVTDRVLSALPVSLELALLGLGMAVLVSVPLAMWAAHRAGGLVDRVIGMGTFGLLSIPTFLAGLLLIGALVNGMGWFPRAEWVRLSEDVVGNLRHAFLPALTVALVESATFTRVLRNDLVDTLGQDFVLASRAKGMPTRHVLFVEALRPSSFSALTLLGISLGRLIGSVVIVEYLFAIPGVGSLIVLSATRGDYPMVQGAVLLAALVYVVSNTLVDTTYGLLDPRVRRRRA